MQRKLTLPLILLMAIVGAGCTREATAPESAPAVTAPDPETTVLINADIVTVDDALPSAEALAIRDGRILGVGSRSEVEAAAGNNIQLRDMQGKTIVPGFIDAHGHISLTAMAVGMANVQSPPAGPVNSIAELQDALLSWAEENPDFTSPRDARCV